MNFTKCPRCHTDWNLTYNHPICQCGLGTFIGVTGVVGPLDELPITDIGYLTVKIGDFSVTWNEDYLENTVSSCVFDKRYNLVFQLKKTALPFTIDEAKLKLYITFS